MRLQPSFVAFHPELFQVKCKSKKEQFREDFSIQSKKQLTISLNNITLFLRFVFLHTESLTQTKAPAKSFLDLSNR